MEPFHPTERYDGPTAEPDADPHQHPETRLTCCEFTAVHERLDRHRDDLDYLYDETFKASRNIETLKISLKKAEELCTSRCMKFVSRILKLEAEAKNQADLETQVKDLTIQVKVQAELESKISDLVAQVKNLSIQVNDLQMSNLPKCADCHKPFTPVKKSHLKCRDCFLSLKVKLCKNCSKPFSPKHHSFKYCPCCSKK